MLMYTITSNAQNDRAPIQDERPRQGWITRVARPSAAPRLHGDAHPADGMRPRKSVRRAATAEGDRPTALAADRDAVSGGHRQRRISKYRQAVGACARIRARDQIPGWHRGEEVHAAVRDRAATLQRPAPADTSA